MSYSTRATLHISKVGHSQRTSADRTPRLPHQLSDQITHGLPARAGPSSHCGWHENLRPLAVIPTLGRQMNPSIVHIFLLPMRMRAVCLVLLLIDGQRWPRQVSTPLLRPRELSHMRKVDFIVRACCTTFRVCCCFRGEIDAAPSGFPKRLALVKRHVRSNQSRSVSQPLTNHSFKKTYSAFAQPVLSTSLQSSMK